MIVNTTIGNSMMDIKKDEGLSLDFNISLYALKKQFQIDTEELARHRKAFDHSKYNIERYTNRLENLTKSIEALENLEKNNGN